MKITRTLKRIIGGALIGVLLFAQMAVAAYACPMQSGAPSAQAFTLADGGPRDNAALQPRAATAMPAMANCDGMRGMDGVPMDADAPGLCAASCHADGQSTQTPSLKLPAVSLNSLPFVAVPAVPVAPDRAPPANPAQWAAASAPLSILYCCFRI